MPDSPPQCNTPLGQNNNTLNQLNQFNNQQQAIAALAQTPNLNINLQLALAAMQNQVLNNNPLSQQNRLNRRGANGSQGATSSG